MITLQTIEKAKERIQDSVFESPCVYSYSLSQALNATVFLKLDNMQKTGSFKERGALNRLLLLSEEEKKKGVVSASAGNHAQAVAYHASRLGIGSMIFMPQQTPLIKVSKTENFGAKVHLEGDNYDECHALALRFAQESGGFYLHAYDDDQVIAGQGTLGLEIAKQVPNLSTVIVPVGGGGLIAGIAVALKDVAPQVELVGVESSLMPSMIKALEAGKPITLEPAQTLADGIRVRRAGDRTYEICRLFVKKWETLSDDEIAKGILHLLEKEKVVAEGAGAIGVALLLNRDASFWKGKTICVVVGGGNIDVNWLGRIIERGMVDSKRLVRLQVTILDRPGELGKFLDQLAITRANVVEIHHERAFAHVLWNDVKVDVVLETRGKNHMDEIVSLIRSKGYAVSLN